jgi:N-acyl-D-amino-acid deacylase
VLDVDLLLRGGSVIDGAGNPAVAADVAVSHGRVAAVGRLDGLTARRVLELDGLTVSPGFVDMHAHSDLQILAEPEHLAKVAQGITTEVLGQDGLSYAPTTDATLEVLRAQLSGWNDDPPGFDWDWRSVGEYLDRLDQGITVNAAYLVPHGTVRMMVVGDEDRPATEVELEEMKRLVARGMEEGAVGLSAGLTYTPGMYASEEELVALCRVVARYGGYYCPHHRNYGGRALEGYAECFRIARAAKVPLHLTHAHLGFPQNRGRAGELLAMVDEAAAEGIEVTLDTYPYLAGSTYLHAILPAWVQEGGADAAVARLRDAELREQIRVEIEETGHPAYHEVPTDWSTVVVTGVREETNRRAVGRSVAEVAAAENRRPIDLYCELLADDQLGATCVHHIGNEDNVRAIMAHPSHTGGSDGILVGDRPHPRAWGTFPRYLGQYARELGVLRLEDAVRKFTSLPAQRLGLWDRGLVRPGHAADLVVFDRDRVDEVGTYEDPRHTPTGLPYVIVNGQVVIDEGQHTGARAGRALRRPGSVPTGSRG